jgi:hypothetical protein
MGRARKTNLQIAVDGTRDKNGGLDNRLPGTRGGCGAISQRKRDRSGNFGDASQWMLKLRQRFWISNWCLKSTDEPVRYEDASRQHRSRGFEADAQLEATVRVPSIDFTFKTDPLDTSRCDFAVMGTEVNGKHYEATKG